MADSSTKNNLVLPPGSTVLVTGATGLIGSHVADQLLSKGYNVRGTTRSARRAQWLSDLSTSRYGPGRLTIVEVPDMVADGAYDAAVKDVDGIIHLASVLTFSDVPDEVIPPTVKGTVNILSSASKESRVKSFVYTSSSTAALLPEPGKKIIVTKDTWNDAVMEMIKSKPEPFTVYAASKTAAERAFWDKIQELKPSFQAVAVLPNANFGPLLNPAATREDYLNSTTASWPAGVFVGQRTAAETMPPQWFIDVRDTARIHVASLIDPRANGERVFAFAEPFNWVDIARILKKAYPTREEIADGFEDIRDLSEIPNGFARDLLKDNFGKDWTSLEESVKDNVANPVLK